MRLLALLPFVAILVGAAYTNQVTPMIFGMPLGLAWQVGCVIGSAAVMGIIYLCDPANREDQAEQSSQINSSQVNSTDIQP
jgi:hypothetical protein